jgi:DNA-binding GntR family transcriptional regulator
MNRKDLATEVYQILRGRILDFKVLPGVKISDAELAKELGISRTPVREALIRLCAHGLVQSSHNRGFSVRVFTIKEVRDLYALREALELLSVKLAIGRMGLDQVAALENLLGTYPELIESRNRARFNQADEDFHLMIAGFSDNRVLEMQLNSLHDQLAILRRYAHLLAENHRQAYEEETYREHLRIFNHMALGKVEDATQAMATHIVASMNSVIEALGDKREPS